MSIKSKYGSEKWIDNGRGKIPLGSGEGQYLPYDLLYGALSACYYYTLESLCEKMKIDYEEVTITIDGKKKEAKIATLERVDFVIEAKGVTEEKKFTKACSLAGKYCSIHATVAKVAKMNHEIIFL
ncbi:MAG TPA: OsmC family protein [Clostridia bacterium]|nr:OsmC family protein [Clostridia bacterium]